MITQKVSRAIVIYPKALKIQIQKRSYNREVIKKVSLKS